MPAKTKEEIAIEKVEKKLSKSLQKKLQAAEKKLEKLRAGSQKKISKLKAEKGKKTKSQIKKQLKKTLWKIISPIVRASSNHCFTCNKPLYPSEKHAGHHWPKGSHRAVEFDMDNLRVQCVSCNLHKSGNLAEYGYRLRHEIGEERWEALYQRKELKRYWTKELLEAEIAKYTGSPKELL